MAKIRIKQGRWWMTMMASFGLAIGTWNPTGHSFVDYIQSVNPMNGFQPVFIVLMLIAWGLMFKAIGQSMSKWEIGGVIILVGAVLYGLNSYNLIDYTNSTLLGWMATLTMGLLIWIGLNWAIIWKKLTGIYATHETSDSDDLSSRDDENDY